MRKNLATSDWRLCRTRIFIHLTGELSEVPPIVVYEYQKTRLSDHPKEYYKDFKGVLMTDGLEQYHKLARELGGIINANCLAHARRHFANAIKAMGKNNAKAVESSIAYKALLRIGTIYKLEETLKTLSPQKRLAERQSSIKPLVRNILRGQKNNCLAAVYCLRVKPPKD